MQAAINFNPTKKNQTMTIEEMCKKIESDEITIPLYQRGLSWNKEKAVELLNYQLFGKAPVSPLSFNEIGSKNTVPQLSLISRKPISENANTKGNLSVVDGQQRLTTNYKAYSNNEEFKNIVLDLSIPKFKKIKGNPLPNQIPVGIVLNKDQSAIARYFEKNYKKKQTNSLIFDIMPILLGVRQKLLSYMYTIHIANNMNEEEQINWFEVLNNAGSRLSTIELKLSKLRLHDFDIYTEFIKPYQEKVKKYGFEKLFTPFSSNVSYPIASLNPAYELIVRKTDHNKNYAPIPSDTKEAMLIKLNKDELVSIKNTTLFALDKALEFIAAKKLNTYITQMQYVMYLTGYFVFNTTVSESDLSQLSDWVKKVSFTNKSNGVKREIFDRLINKDLA